MHIFFNGVSVKLLFLTTISLLMYTANAQTIGKWTFDNTLAGTAGPHNTVSAAVLAPAITSGGYYNETMYYGEGSWPSGSTIDINKYLEFSLTPHTGYTLNLSSIEFNMRRGTQNGQGPKAWALRSSLDGFTSDIATGSLSPSTATQTILLNNSFSNLISQIKFRVYGYSANGTKFAWDNIAVKELTLLSTNIISLTGRFSDNKSEISWNVDKNDELNCFDIERSENGHIFSIIGKVFKQTNNSYSFTDKGMISGSYVWYRIKATDVNGYIKYSDVIKLSKESSKRGTINNITINGNQLVANVNVVTAGTAKILLTTIDGRIIAHQSISLLKGIQLIQVNRSSTPGMQIFSIIQKDQVISRQFVN